MRPGRLTSDPLPGSLVSAVALVLALAGTGCTANGAPGSGAGEGSPPPDTGFDTDPLADAGGPPGCYRFRDGADARALGLPWGIVLDDVALEEGWPLTERWDGVRRARTATSATGRADHPFRYWRPVEGDSIEVGHPGGGGLVLTLAPAEGGLAGRGRSAGDALAPGEAAGPRPSRPVRAERVSCPS